MLKVTSKTTVVKNDFAKFQEAVAKIKNQPYIKIGILAEKNESVDDDFNLASLGAVHEFGTKRAGRNNDIVIPQRSWLRSTMAEKRSLFLAATKNAIFSIALGEDIMKHFGRIGLLIASEMKKKIGSNIKPANKPSTIARKGSSTTLIDTGRLRASIAHKVVLGGEE